MKKFLIYVVCAVTLLFLGFTVYYIAQNDEKIYLNIDGAQTIYINKDDIIEWPVVWTKPHKDTKLSVVIGDEKVLKYDSISKNFTGTNGGKTSVTITSSNKNFGPFVFEVSVGDGKLGSPYMIQTAQDLAKIGTDTTFTSDKCYALSNDIDLKTFGKWTALPEFSGNFNGNGHTIFNLELNSSEFGGLFQKIDSVGVVENVNFKNVNIDGEFSYLGAVAGINKGLVGKVNVSGNIINRSMLSETGAIVGQNEFTGSQAYINMCSSDVTAWVSGHFGGLVGLNNASVILNSTAVLNYSTNSGLSVGGLVGVNSSYFDENNQIYYPAAIVKSYVIVNSLCIDGNYQGAVAGNNLEDDNNNPINKNIYQDVIYSLGDGVTLNSVHGDELDNDATISLKSKSELLLAETYNNYNLDTVWTLNENEYAKPNSLGAYETVIIKGLTSEYNSNNYELIDFIQSISQNPENNIVYYVTTDEVLDLKEIGKENWKTIAPDSKNPLKASIIVEEGASLTIKNFTLSENNTSFFGYIGAGSLIKGIKFENVTITSNSENVAVVATSVEAGAQLENISVNSVTVNSSAKYVALITAFNFGNVYNTSINGTNEITVLAQAGVQRHIGGLVAYNYGSVSNGTVNSFKVILNTASEGGNFNIGGAVGTTESSISNISVNSFEMDTLNDGLMYVGGVVGYASTNSDNTINNSYSKANLSLNINTENSYVGGVVAFISAGFKVTNSAFAVGTLKAYNVGGLVSVNNGEIYTSYAEGSLKGILVAGIATTTYGKIINCYTLSTLNGENNNSRVSGITNLVGPDCVIDKCLSSATFTGNGSRFAESASEFRASWLPKFILDVEYGSVTNLIIVNYGNARIQSSILGGRTGWIDATDEDCKGKNDYAVLKDKAGFDPSVWNFENEGSYPTLKTAVKVG